MKILEALTEHIKDVNGEIDDFFYDYLEKLWKYVSDGHFYENLEPYHVGCEDCIAMGRRDFLARLESEDLDRCKYKVTFKVSNTGGLLNPTINKDFDKTMMDYTYVAYIRCKESLEELENKIKEINNYGRGWSAEILSAEECKTMKNEELEGIIGELENILSKHPINVNIGV